MRSGLLRGTCVCLVTVAAAASLLIQRTSAGELVSVSPRGVSTSSALHVVGTGFDRTAATNIVTFLQRGVVVGTASGRALVDVERSTGQRRLTVEVPAGVPVGSTDLRVVNQATGEISEGASVEIIAIVLPEIVGGARGTNRLDVRVTGSENTRFIPGGTAVSFGEGITTRSVLVQSPTSLIATISIDRRATLGARAVLTETTAQSAVIPGAFTVTADGAPNYAPIAHAGGPYSGMVGQPVQFDGTRSSDPDGDALTFSWHFGDGHMGTGARPIHVYGSAGRYVVTLIVTDGRNGSGTASTSADIVRLDVPRNRPPVAVIAPVGEAYVAQLVTLDGSGSHDPDGDGLTFAWSLVGRPDGSAAMLNAPATDRPTFLPDRPGTYVVRLQVSDDQVTSAADLSISTSNSPPVADAGPDQTVSRNATVVLDGSRSNDVDGDPLTFLWSFVSKPAGSVSMVSDPTAVRPTFGVDQPGTYVLRLVVNDGHVSSEVDLVIVTTLNSVPVADAGPDRTARRGALVLLDASGSTDVDGDALTYAWELVTVPTGSTTTLVNPTSVQTSFVADVRGEFVIRLTVSDGHATSQDTVTITTENTKPVANAGADLTASLGATVTLDGSGSTDVDGDSLVYQWSMVSAPAGTSAVLSATSTVAPTFVVDQHGDYIIQLVVNDGLEASEPDTVTVSTENTRPVADAGGDHSVLVGAVILLDGSGSYDADGDALSYAWSLTSLPAGSIAALNDPASVTPSFVVDRAGTYVVQLIVHDGRLASLPDTVTITTNANTPPVADAGPDQTGIVVYTRVTLDGSGSYDADGQPLTFEWSLLSVPAGSTAALSDRAAAQPTFMPDL